MREKYILQSTESNPGTGNQGPQRQKMAVSCWQYDFRVEGVHHPSQVAEHII